MSRLYTDEQLAEIARPFEDHALDALAHGDISRVRELLVEMKNGNAGLDGLSGHTLARKAAKLRKDFGEAFALDALKRIGAQLMAAGLVVNLFSPHGSAFRTIEWVRILGLHRDQNLKHDVFRLIHTDAVFAEYEGVLELARSLEEGIFEGLSPYAKMWLDHAIAASTNRKYRARLIIQNELRRIQFKIGALWIQENLMPMPILGALGECALESMSEWVFSQRELKAKSGCGPSSRQD